MEKKFIYSLFILLSFGIKGNVFAQAKLGMVDKISYLVPTAYGSVIKWNDSTTIAIKDTIVIKDSTYFAIQNKGDSTYNGFIELYYSVNNSIPYLLKGDTIKKYTLYPNDITVFNVPLFYIDSTKFKPGVNIVVVWPTGSNNVAIVDSFRTYILIKDTSSLGFNNYADFNKNITIFPNPVLDELIIHYSGIKNDIEQVRIFNVLGEQLFIGREDNRIINIKNYPEGIYFVEILFKESNNRIVKKFVKKKD